MKNSRALATLAVLAIFALAAISPAFAVTKSFQLAFVGMQQGKPLNWFGKIHASECNGIMRGPDGALWGLFGPYLTQLGEDYVPKTGYVLNPAFRVPQGADAPKFKVVTVKPPAGLAKPMKISAFTFTGNRALLVSDEANAVILQLDLDKAAYVWKSPPVKKPTQAQNAKVYDSQPDRFKTEPPALGVACRMADGSYLVAEKTGSFWIVLNNKGETVDWFAYYLTGDPAAPNEQRLNAPSDLRVMPDGTVVALLPLNKGIIRIDPRTRWAKWFAGSAATFVGNFLSLTGWAMVPGRPTQFLVTDNTLCHLQVFDIETGDYLYSFGLPEKKPDPTFNGNRPTCDFGSPRSPFFSKDGKKLYFQSAVDQFFYQYDILDPLPQSKKP